MRSFRIPSFRSTVFFSLIYCIKKLPSDSATPQSPSPRHLYLENLASLMLSFRVCSIAHPYLVIQTVKITFCLTTVVLNFSKPLTYVSESGRRTSRSDLSMKRSIWSHLYIFCLEIFPSQPNLYSLSFSHDYTNHTNSSKVSTRLHQKQKKKIGDGNSKC